MLEKIIFLLIAITTLVVAYYIAYHLIKTHSFDFLISRGDRLGAIDGLRGYLALMVFVSHFELVWHWKNTGIWSLPSASIFHNFGVVGVNIFFMITGFLFLSKVISDDYQVNWLKLLNSRVFRIFPLYLALLVAMSAMIFWGKGFQLNVPIFELLQQYMDWLLFKSSNINLYEDSAMMTAQVQWTLRYEWFFYLSLPLLALILKRGLMAGLLLLMVMILGTIYPQSIAGIKTSLLKFFVFGVIAAYLVVTFPKLAPIARSPIMSVIMAIALLLSLFLPSHYGPVYIVMLPIFFIPIAFGNNFFGLFSKMPSVILGEISYSIYLLHGLTLFYLFTFLPVIAVKQLALITFLSLMPVVCIAVVLFSAIAYLTIEATGIRFGKRVWTNIPTWRSIDK
jgi:peptidoglycan/LPS O-acetylase OafA/YrhL